MSESLAAPAFVQSVFDEARSSTFHPSAGTSHGEGEGTSLDEAGAQECVIDIRKDGTSIRAGDQSHALPGSTAGHIFVGSFTTGIARTICRQANISLAKDADIVIRLRPKATATTRDATQTGTQVGQTSSRGRNGQKARDEIQALLVRNKVDPEQARIVAMNELNGWSFEHVKAIFDQLPKDRKDYPLGPNFNLPGVSGLERYAWIVSMYSGAAFLLLLSSPILLLMCFFRGPSKVLRQMNFRQMTSALFYVKPSIKMIRAAADNGQALCVNRRGRFKLMNSGYTALSHVDAQTFGWNGPKGVERVPEDERGLSLDHLLKIFDGITVPKDEWIWLDNLAIPQRLDADLKSRCINHMPNIYQHASRVLILDALTLQMNTSSLTDVAVVLASGKWMSRAWCYQELKLADWESAAVVTANGKANVASMLRQLHLLARNDEAMHYKLFRTFQRLQTPRDQLSLGDIAGVCQTRKAGLDEDYARAFYPTLGLLWKPEYDRVQGMIKLYESRPQQVAQLAALHGPRGLPDPWGWAPAYLCGNEGRVREDLTINDLGELVGKWWSIEVLQVLDSFQHGAVSTAHNLKVNSTTNPEDSIPQITVTNGTNLRTKYEERIKMSEATNRKFKEWADKIQSVEQKTFLLCSESMNVGRDFAIQVLLVALEERSNSPVSTVNANEAGKPVELRARVFLSAALTVGKFLGTQEEWKLV